MKELTILLLNFLTISVFGQVNYTHYSRTEVKQDLNFAFEKLTNIHPLFLDKNKLIQYQSQFSEIKKMVKDSMTQNEVYLLMAPIFASLNDGHTGVIVPMDQRLEYTKAGGKSFPFFVNIIDDSVCVSFYCGNETSLFRSGEQILKINGINTTEMVSKMESLSSGESLAIKQKAIANKFRFLVWILYGFENDYELFIKDNQNDTKKMIISGVTSAKFMQNIKRIPKANQEYYSLEIKQEIETAIMQIKSFRDLDGFCTFADSAFSKLKESKVENLIIDIRNNGGGRSIVVHTLMSYLTNKMYALYKKTEVRISQDLKEYYEKRYPDRLDWINSYTIDELVVLDRNLNKHDNNNLRFKWQIVFIDKFGNI